MSLERLQISNFRNFGAIDLEFDDGINLLSGANGSGKTSILEAIYFLTHGRSFRTSSINRIIHHDTSSFTLFGLFTHQAQLKSQAGIIRYRNGECRIKVNGTDNCNLVALVNIQPLLLINPTTFHLLDAGPLQRRQFIDWGLFHVEHQFFSVWKRLQRVLKQRNAALKRKDGMHQAKLWDNEFVASAQSLNNLRKSYVAQLKPIFLELVQELTGYPDINMSYLAGWDENTDLNEVLERAYERDSLLGYTQFGPQKADIIIKSDNVPAVELFSRGEQKLLVYALKLAQGMLLQKTVAKNCIYLIDDLAAELDEQNQKKLFQVLTRLHTQVIATSVEPNPSYLPVQDIMAYQLEKGSLVDSFKLK